MLTCCKFTKIKYNIYWKIISASWVGNKHAISLVIHQVSGCFIDLGIGEFCTQNTIVLPHI